jgi:hypothetical protein
LFIGLFVYYLILSYSLPFAERLPPEDPLFPLDVLRLLLELLRPVLALLRPPLREASPPLRATSFLVLSLAEANPLLEVLRPEEELPSPVLLEELRPPAALLAELLLREAEALLVFEAAERPVLEPELPLVEAVRLVVELERPFEEPELPRLLSPEAPLVDDALAVDEELLFDDAPSLSALRLRF